MAAGARVHSQLLSLDDDAASREPGAHDDSALGGFPRLPTAARALQRRPGG